MRFAEQLPVQGHTIMLREAKGNDIPAIVELLVDDHLGAGRDGATIDSGLRPYQRTEAEATEPCSFVTSSSGPGRSTPTESISAPRWSGCASTRRQDSI
jgi:hypothetical protein